MVKSIDLKFLVITFAVMMIALNVYSQNDLTRYFYDNGVVSSEGFMKDGKPDGYWKTFYPSGGLKTEGNRKNFMLDSVWKFYRADSTLERTITYSEDIKNGVEEEYDKSGRLLRNYTNVNGIREGRSAVFYDSGELWKVINFTNNKEEGKSLEYDRDGRVITLNTYRNGFLYASEKINRYNSENKRSGPWKELYPNGQIREEGDWSNGLRNGIFKFYDKKGFLERIEKYADGELVKDDDQTAVLDIRKEYDEEGNIRMVGSYREGKRQGTFRNYDSQGREGMATLYEADEIIGEGFIDSIGRKQGIWKLYYPGGQKRSEGAFVDGLKDGPWIFYFRSGQIEQKGSFKSDASTGAWNWYFENGTMHREELYRRGKEDGHSVEYDSLGIVLNEGDYVDGLKTGMWKLTVNDHTEEGVYADGEKNGTWVWYYGDGKKAFEGDFALGLPTGKHRYWYSNGQLKMRGGYEGGELNGDWEYFDESGFLTLVMEYRQGIAVRINGRKIKSSNRDGNTLNNE